MPITHLSAYRAVIPLSGCLEWAEERHGEKRGGIVGTARKAILMLVVSSSRQSPIMMTIGLLISVFGAIDLLQTFAVSFTK